MPYTFLQHHPVPRQIEQKYKFTKYLVFTVLPFFVYAMLCRVPVPLHWELQFDFIQDVSS